MSKIKFSIYSFIFILLSYVSQALILNLDNGTVDRFIIFVLGNVILYILYTYIILKFAKENLLTKKSLFLIFTLLIISFIVFPMIFQIIVWISCLVLANSNTENIKGDDMLGKKVSDSLMGIAGIVLAIFLTITYCYGGYKLLVDENYSKLQVVIGFIIPPYPVYVGTKEIYLVLSNED